jgi:tetratricopeptide (TPR) repeat protein
MRQVGLAALTALVGLLSACSSGVQLNSTPLDPAPKTARIQDLSMAIARSPRDPKFYVERAQAYEANGQYKTALADLDEAMTLRPDSAKYRYLRGIAYAYAGDEQAAKQDFARAEAMEPDSAESYNARAWLMATAPDPQMRDGKKAVESATRACEMTNWNDPDMLGTLAAAYAETGNFADAIKWQQKALDLTSPTLLVTFNERQARLALYQNHRPWRPAPPNHPLTPS